MVGVFGKGKPKRLYRSASAQVVQRGGNFMLRLEVDMALFKTLYYLDANDMRPAFGQGGVVEICG